MKITSENMPNESQVSPQELLERVLARIEPDAIGETLEALLSAESRGRDGTVQPDHRTRLEAAKLILAYTVGQPIQREHRIEEQRGKGDGYDDLRRSKSLRAAVRRDLDRLDAEEADRSA